LSGEVAEDDVSIPQWCDCCRIHFTHLVSQGGFNPTMVRLLPSLSSISLTTSQWFQSHNGAIAAKATKPHKKPHHKFQSHNGAIAAEVNVSFNYATNQVSIPQWCDCCRNLTGFPCQRRHRFNPTMVRLLLYEYSLAIPNGSSFNPTMVRLLLTALAWGARAGLVFQSHNGAIAARLSRVTS